MSVHLVGIVYQNNYLLIFTICALALQQCEFSLHCSLNTYLFVAEWAQQETGVHQTEVWSDLGVPVVI